MAATTTKVMRFAEGQKQMLNSLKQNFSQKTEEGESSFNNFETLLESLTSMDLENKKLVLDQVFREFLTGHLLSPKPDTSPDIAACQDFLVNYVIKAAKKGQCSPGTAVLVLADMFDILPLTSCEVLFKTVEQEVSTWREQLFYSSAKINLLRICNDLLRRLSRTQNTVFCGRILLFLAKFFPFSERSGLNVISEFNLDNTTNFNQDEEEKDNSSEESKEKSAKPESEDPNVKVNRNLYQKFWQIQDYFRNPVQCYEKDPWKTFSGLATDVLKIFHSFKLDQSSGKSSSGSSNTEQYFAKYLTNQNLLQLQLSDSNFRRYILLQFLILFQYLKSNVKFKTDNQVLSGDQAKWTDETTKKIYKLLEETPPNGKEFCKSVTHILEREEHWNKWKNEGCPSSAKKRSPEEKEPELVLGEKGSYRRKKRPLGDVIRKEVAAKRVNLGNSGLTTLWNLNPDNLEACRAKERDFLPSLESYLEEAIEQLDPKNEIEDTYKKINNGEWGWRALRLMSRRSTHFFISGNNPIDKLPKYLESMLGKMAKEMPAPPKEEGADVSQEEMETEEADTARENSKVDEAQMVQLASKLSSHWLKLAPKFGVPDEKITEIKSLTGDDEAKCLELLKVWVEIEKEGATKEEIIYILEGLKLASCIDGVFTE